MPNIDLATLVKWLVIITILGVILTIGLAFGTGASLLARGVSALRASAFMREPAAWAFTVIGDQGTTMRQSFVLFQVFAFSAAGALAAWRAVRWFQ